MTKTPCRDGLDTSFNERKKKKTSRKLPESRLRDKNNMKTISLKVMLGKGAKKELLDERACPTRMSPKRDLMMDVDPSTPIKRKKRVARIDSKQKLITDVWKVEEGNQ